MLITKIQITKTFDKGLLKAHVAVYINGFYFFGGIQIIQGIKRLFVTMPNIYDEEKIFTKLIDPIYPEARQDFESSIIDAYNKYIEATKIYTDFLNKRTVYEIARTKGPDNMRISDIKIRKINDNSNIKAIVSVKFDDCIAVHNIKIVQSEDRLLVVMPSIEIGIGIFHDIAQHVYSQAKEDFDTRIIDAYNNINENNNTIDDLSENVEIPLGKSEHNLNITEVYVRKIFIDKDIKALVSVTFNYYLTVHDIKIICVDDRLFFSMPSCKDENGNLKDLVHIIYPELRDQFEKTVIDNYHKALKNAIY